MSVFDYLLPSPARWLPSTTRVAPLASVKSVSAQRALTSTSYSSGNGKKSQAHWSRWMA